MITSTEPLRLPHRRGGTLALRSSSCSISDAKVPSHDESGISEAGGYCLMIIMLAERELIPDYPVYHRDII